MKNSIMPKGKCAFNDRWLDNVRYKQWLVPVPGDVYSARCTLCKKTFGILSMGEPALKSHAKGTKHCSLANSSEGSTVMEDFCTVANEVKLTDWTSRPTSPKPQFRVAFSRVPSL